MSVKRFQSVSPAAFIFSKNILQYSHTYTKMCFNLALSLATSQELEQILASVMLQQPLGLSPVFSLVGSRLFLLALELSVSESCWGGLKSDNLKTTIT